MVIEFIVIVEENMVKERIKIFFCKLKSKIWEKDYNEIKYRIILLLLIIDIILLFIIFFYIYGIYLEIDKYI